MSNKTNIECLKSLSRTGVAGGVLALKGLTIGLNFCLNKLDNLTSKAVVKGTEKIVKAQITTEKK